MMWTFQRLIDPVGESTFFKDFWEQQPLVVARDDGGRHRSLLSFDDVDRALDTLDIKTLRLRIARDGKSGAESRIDNVDEALEAFRDGGTLVMSALHKNWPALAGLCRAMEHRISHPFQTNIYLTPPNAQGFAPHFDSHDVFILQVEGQKQWTIYDRPSRFAVASRSFAQTGVGDRSVLSAFTLRAGDVAYIPRGFVHEATTGPEPSLHITLGALSITWSDLLRDALARLAEDDAAFREAVPPGYAHDADAFGRATRRLGELLDQLARNIEPRAVLDAQAERFVQGTHPEVRGRLLEEVRGLDVSIGDELGVRDGVSRSLAERGDRVALSFHGKELTFPRVISPALRTLLEAGQIRVGSLPGNLDAPGQLVLSRTLLREGLLCRR